MPELLALLFRTTASSVLAVLFQTPQQPLVAVYVQGVEQTAAHCWQSCWWTRAARRLSWLPSWASLSRGTSCAR